MLESSATGERGSWSIDDETGIGREFVRGFLSCSVEESSSVSDCIGDSAIARRYDERLVVFSKPPRPNAERKPRVRRSSRRFSAAV
mmetsp:Transcript_5610/g.7955  ORF Transcript_5610/g.7955 Transcript_5610/m.7955 type:complete len:86 (+) Transcript_5610:115-372(+)